MKLLLCFLWCALMSGQTPEARSHFRNAQGLFGEHDDSGDALAEAEREFRLALKADPNYAAAQAYLKSEVEKWGTMVRTLGVYVE